MIIYAYTISRAMKKDILIKRISFSEEDILLALLSCFAPDEEQDQSEDKENDIDRAGCTVTCLDESALTCLCLFHSLLDISLFRGLLFSLFFLFFLVLFVLEDENVRLRTSL